MDDQVELEICGNCKKEIPHFNYVMHTAHCARNITLCQTCKEPIPKSQYEDHKRECNDVKKSKKRTTPPPPLKMPQNVQREYAKTSSYVQRNHNGLSSIVQENSTSTSSSSNVTYKKHGTNYMSSSNLKEERKESNLTNGSGTPYGGGDVGGVGTGVGGTSSISSSISSSKSIYSNSKKSGMLACKFCDLELPKLDLEEHENYCGARTDKCNVCGEIVMFKYKKIHEDSNHGFVKLNDEPGPKASWDSTTERGSNENYRNRPFTYETTRSIYENYVPPVYDLGESQNEKKESYKDISRRLDCKTEYIRNLLHDSASITVPIRHTGTVPRNHYNHNKGPAPKPPQRRRNPPTELVIPCEFCNLPIPHEDLIQHETGCRPDLARRRRSPSPDDYFIRPEPSSPEVELPCEFCADMIPASQLLSHQATCVST